MTLHHEVRITCDAADGCDAAIGPCLSVLEVRNVAAHAGWMAHRQSIPAGDRVTSVVDTWRCPEHRAAR